jgi:hypothetical protein
MAKTGRPKQPEGEKYLTKALRFPSALWQELEALVPAGERSAFIHAELARGLKRRRRQAAKSQRAPQPAAALPPEELTPEERSRRVNAAFGSMAHLPISVDQVLARKREEAEREEEIWERRRREGGRGAR